MSRLFVWLMFLGCLIGLLTAALFEGLTGPGTGEYLVVSSFSGANVTVSEPLRYLMIAAAGAAMGAVGAGVLRAAGAQVPPHRRVGLTVAVGVIGCVVGVLPALIAVTVAADLPGWLPPLLLYAVTGALGYGLAVTAVYLALRTVGDHAIRPTTRATALVLPVGALLATAAGVTSAWVLGFSTVTSTWVVVITLVVLILSATFAAARAIGLRQPQPE